MNGGPSGRRADWAGRILLLALLLYLTLYFLGTVEDLFRLGCF
jgi:hypothetical protein